MKKLILALSAVAAFSAPALAADMSAKAPMRAAPMAYAPSWTGCYIGAGGGGGFYDQETVLALTPTVSNVRLDQGGRGWLATVGGGCDYQFSGLSGGIFGNGIVVGAFADGDWTSIRGFHTGQNGAVGLISGEVKLNWSWAVGGRAGILVTPNLLTYISGGYTEAQFSGTSYLNTIGLPTTLGIPGQRYQGWFLGAGDEYSLSNWVPGLFWKTEYRFADYGTKNVPTIITATGLPTGVLESTHPFTHTIRSELTYHFNWGGAPIAARY